MLLADRLSSLLVQENIQDREVQVDATNEFLESQLEDARRRLVEHDKRLADFRRVNAGRLPTQAQSNLQLLQTTQARLQANTDGAFKDRERLTQLEALIEQAVSTPVPATLPADRPARGPASATPGAAEQLEAARASLRALELRLKPEHPDIGRAKRLIADLEVKAESESLAAVLAPKPAAVPSPRDVAAAAKRLADMRQEVQDIQARLEARKRDDERLTLELAEYTARLEAAPALESQLAELNRDYATIQEQYTTLLRKSEESRIAVDLERRQVGEQFRVIDGARLPERPASPNRTRLNLMGLLGGLALGIALAALLEYRDTTLKTDDDVVTSLSLPVLAVIPAMVTAGDRRRMRRRKVLALSAAVVSLVAIGAILWRWQLIPAWVS
jgi:uncharacterized protein involved in exopolysaccharide biosynthesis